MINDSVSRKNEFPKQKYNNKLSGNLGPPQSGVIYPSSSKSNQHNVSAADTSASLYAASSSAATNASLYVAPGASGRL